MLIWIRAALAALIIYWYLLFGLLSPAFSQNPYSGFNPASLTGEKTGIFLEAKAFGAENTRSLQHIFLDRPQGPSLLDNANRLDASWNTGTGLFYHGFRFAAFYRGEVYMEANGDTVQVLRMINKKQNLPVGEIFTVDIRSSGFSAFSLEVSKGSRLDRMIPGLSMGITLRYLQGDELQEGYITGQFMPTGKTSYWFNLFIDYAYDRNLVYERQSTIPGTGRGYSFDLGIDYALSGQCKADILFRDIGGRIYWQDTPYTTADATSDTQGYDSDGYQTYRPLIRGYEGYKDYTQKIPLKTDILFSYRLGSFTLTPAVCLIESRPFYWLDLYCQATGNLSFHAGYNLNYQAFSLGASFRNALLTIMGNDIDINKIKVIGLMLSLSCH
ncbi:MAG: hypothetical protein AB1847_00140 [bacterium]